MISENRAARKVKQENDEGLIKGLAKNHLTHVYVEEGRGLAIREAFQRLGCRGVGGERKRGQRFRDDADSEQLHSRESGRFLGRRDRGVTNVTMTAVMLTEI